MVEGSSDLREQRKAWAQRNSDGKATFERERTQPPPAFSLEEETLPDTNQKITSPEYDDAAAIRHVHVYGVEDPDA